MLYKKQSKHVHNLKEKKKKLLMDLDGYKLGITGYHLIVFVK